jgi:hypothetical protein
VLVVVAVFVVSVGFVLVEEMAEDVEVEGPLDGRVRRVSMILVEGRSVEDSIVRRPQCRNCHIGTVHEGDG